MSNEATIGQFIRDDEVIKPVGETYTRPDFHINPDDYPEDVVAEAGIRADERGQCCKDICGRCEAGIPVVLADGKTHGAYKHSPTWLHEPPYYTWPDECHANAIRRRAFAEEKAKKALDDL